MNEHGEMEEVTDEEVIIYTDYFPIHLSTCLSTEVFEGGDMI